MVAAEISVAVTEARDMSTKTFAATSKLEITSKRRDRPETNRGGFGTYWL